jgi:trans-aconitate 2-methyltransferase
VTRADWNPDQYRRFAAERSAPFFDLLGLVEPVAAPSVVDLGCGSGELTVEAAARLGASTAIGVDNSPAMLEAARHLDGGVVFEAGDIGTWTSPDGVDVLIANASLHWVPDHAAVLARWTSSLTDDGQLAVQVPANADHPSHLVAAQVAASEPFVGALGGSPPPDPVAANVLAPEEYATLLYELGFRRQHVRLQVYGHVLGSSADVVEWTRGTTLTRFFAALPDELHEPFVHEYRRQLLAVLGDTSPYFYPFKRVLIWARR